MMSSPPRNNYNYDSLDSETIIRILHLNPGRDDEPLTGKLELADIGTGSDSDSDPDSIPTYKALSYVWGDPAKQGVIYLGECQLGLTHNLEVALLRLRHECDVVTLWVDGVCINQDDLNERGHQVKLMGKIYSKATQVIAWLGPDPENRAATVISSLLQDQPASLNKRLRAFETMLKFKWFSRLWVVQEVVLAQDVLFLWGDQSVPHLTIKVLARHLNRRQRDSHAWIGQFWTRFDDNYDIIQALTWTKGLNCSDERDRVYGILGLPYLDKHQVVEAVEPDYSKHVEDVFYELALNYIQKGYLSRLWSSIHHSADWNPLEAKLPSWASDMAQSPKLSRSRFLGCNGSIKYQPPIAMVNSSNRSLGIYGCILAHVSLIAHDSMGDGSFQRSLEYIAIFWKTNIKEIEGRRGRRYHPDETYLFARMLFSHILQINEDYCEIRDRTDADEEGIIYDGFITDEIASVVKEFGDHEKYTANAEQTPLSEMLSVLSQSSHKFRTLWMDSPSWCQQILPSFWRCHKLFITSDGRSGLGPLVMKPEDLVVIVPGCEFPAILRPYKDQYFFVGNASVSGVYEWPTIKAIGKTDDDLQSFTLR